MGGGPDPFEPFPEEPQGSWSDSPFDPFLIAFTEGITNADEKVGGV